MRNARMLLEPDAHELHQRFSFEDGEIECTTTVINKLDRYSYRHLVCYNRIYHLYLPIIHHNGKGFSNYLLEELERAIYQVGQALECKHRHIVCSKISVIPYNITSDLQVFPGLIS